MDILSHGLWGGVIAGRRNKKNFIWAFLFGIAPDLFSFGIFTGMTILGLASGPDWSAGVPLESDIPQYVHHLYDFTHSAVVFLVFFLIVWAVRRRPFWPMTAWFLHIALDFPTHTAKFFPTPILWPFVDVRFSGIPWSHPIIFIPNVVLLVLVYVWVYVILPRKRRNMIK